MEKSIYPISATFIDEISHYMADANWDLDDWAKEFDYMQEVGIDTVVIIRGGYDNRMVYPSKYFPHIKEEDEDFAEFIFSQADARGMKVFMGLYITTLIVGDADEEVEKNKIYVDEVLERYAHHKSFVGWYLPHEAQADYDGKLTKLMTELSALCKSKTPEKLTLISPFFSTEVEPVPEIFTPERTYEEWKRILKDAYKNIDICAFQDGTSKFWKYEEYLKAVKKICDEYDIETWANVELFDRDPRRRCYPIQFEVLKYKIKVAEPYVKKYITFDFARFMSPQSIFISGRNLNKLYKKYYQKKAEKEKGE